MTLSSNSTAAGSTANGISPQTPALGVLLIDDWGSSRMYRAVCTCSNDDCSHVIDISASDCAVEVTIYAHVRTNFWTKTRWSHMWSLLTTGHAKFETTIVLNQQSACNYAHVLQQAVGDVSVLKDTANFPTAATNVVDPT